MTRVFDSGELWGPFGRETVELEREFASFVGTRHCLLVNSGTAALHCALVGAGVGPGDEVIVPALTFVASAQAVLHAGAQPVFADIDPVTFTVDPAHVEALVGPRTRAIMPVHVHGLPADLDTLGAIAQRHDLAIVEDACQAHGATFRGEPVGRSRPSAFSLNGSKLLPAGEGGLFVTGDHDSIAAARRLAIFGEDVVPLREPGQTRSYRSHSVGWNYRSSELVAAIARVRLRRLPHLVETARANAAILTRGLAELAGFEPPHVPPDRQGAFYRYRIRLRAPAGCPALEWRDRVLHALSAENVDAGTWQLDPVPSQPLFGRPREEFPETARLLDGSIVLGTAEHPIFNQEPPLMERYVEAFAKLAPDPEAVLAADYIPVRPT